MKTITEVIAIFPNTRPEQWRQHENGRGWIFETAYAELKSYVAGLVSGDAWVSGNAQVSGDAWVSGNAQVSGNAKVYGNAQVSGDAQVFGDAWVSGNAWVLSPLYLQGTRHAMTLCSLTEIAIGCHVHTIALWKKEYRKIGLREGYSKSEIQEYSDYITLFAKTAKRFQRSAKAAKKVQP